MTAAAWIACGACLAACLALWWPARARLAGLEAQARELAARLAALEAPSPPVPPERGDRRALQGERRRLALLLGKLLRSTEALRSPGAEEATRHAARRSAP
jgi:hypothetical protein